MKTAFKLIVLLIAFQVTACKDEPNGNESKEIEMLTAHTWANAQVTHDDGDLSDQYENFAIVFTKNPASGFDGTFVVSNGGYAFSESSGLWKFNEDFSKIILNSGKEMDAEINEEQLLLEFAVAPETGRLMGTSGNFLFNLQPL